jgi:ABC-type nitrate/sulfonate/bicarbonate transport system permease component
MSAQKSFALKSSPFLRKVFPPTILLIITLLIWEGVVRYFHTPNWLLPAPTRIFLSFHNFGSILNHVGQTILEAMSGFCISAVVGVGLSAALVHFKVLERALFPYVVVSNSIPIIAILPLLTIWFGFGIFPKIMISAIISFFPIVTNVTRGLKSADPRVLDFMRSINANGWEVFSKVQFPSALPFMFAGFKIASSLSLVGAVVSEFYSSEKGLGFLIITAANQLQTDLLFVAITCLAIVGIGLFSLFGRLERMVGRWESQ